MTLRALVDTMFERTLEQSRGRPGWLTGGDPVSDAQFRLSVSLAAPALLVTLILLAAFNHVYPGAMGRRLLGLVAGGAVFTTGMATYWYLGSRFYSRRPHHASMLTGAEPSLALVRVAEIFCTACIPGLCVAVYLLFSPA